jgi:hypothetical protein
MARVVAEPNSTDDISRILKRRGQKMFEQCKDGIDIKLLQFLLVVGLFEHLLTAALEDPRDIVPKRLSKSKPTVARNF